MDKARELLNKVMPFGYQGNSEQKNSFILSSDSK